MRNSFRCVRQSVSGVNFALSYILAVRLTKGRDDTTILVEEIDRENYTSTRRPTGARNASHDDLLD
jgi:hypothetical protein